MIYIGLDPGLSGGIALITEDEIVTLSMPIIKTKKKTLDNLTLSQIFSGYSTLKTYAVLEEQHAMPKQGVTSMFSIGYGFGVLKQCLVDFSIPHEVVRAQAWQKEYFISKKKGNTKAQSIQICKDLFPDVNLLPTPKSKKPSDGIADALLIALYAKRRYEGKLNAQKSD